MEDDWERLADEKIVIPAQKVSNKWDGEDEEEDVKDSWEQEPEPEEKPTSTTTSPVKETQKLSKSKLAEKERLANAEEEKRLANMTPEEKLAEKLRLQKLQQDSDLNFALETFGVSAAGIDNCNPQSKEEFKEFGAKLSSRLSQYRESPHFPLFVEELVRNICLNLTPADIKKVKICVEVLHSEKLKMEQQGKKSTKGKVKVSLRADKDDMDGLVNYDGDDFGDYDDFM